MVGTDVLWCPKSLWIEGKGGMLAYHKLKWCLGIGSMVGTDVRWCPKSLWIEGKGVHACISQVSWYWRYGRNRCAVVSQEPVNWGQRSACLHITSWNGPFLNCFGRQKQVYYDGSGACELRASACMLAYHKLKLSFRLLCWSQMWCDVPGACFASV